MRSWGDDVNLLEKLERDGGRGDEDVPIGGDDRIALDIREFGFGFLSYSWKRRFILFLLARESHDWAPVIIWKRDVELATSKRK